MDDWEYPHFRKPPYFDLASVVWTLMLLATVDSAVFKPLASLQPLRQKTRNSVAGISWILMACHECVKKWLLRSMAVSDLFLLTLYSLLERHILENYKSLTFYSMNSMISMYSMSHSSPQLAHIQTDVTIDDRNLSESRLIHGCHGWPAGGPVLPVARSIDGGPPRNLFSPAVVLRRSEHANRY